MVRRVASGVANGVHGALVGCGMVLLPASQIVYTGSGPLGGPTHSQLRPKTRLY